MLAGRFVRIGLLNNRKVRNCDLRRYLFAVDGITACPGGEAITVRTKRECRRYSGVCGGAKAQGWLVGNVGRGR